MAVSIRTFPAVDEHHARAVRTLDHARAERYFRRIGEKQVHGRYGRDEPMFRDAHAFASSVSALQWAVQKVAMLEFELGATDHLVDTLTTRLEEFETKSTELGG